MDNRKFSNWVKFNNRNELKKYNWEYPGIYAIAYSKNDISNNTFEYIEDIVYFGMTNSKKGLKGRLENFNTTINNKHNLHGGAERFCYHLPKEDKLWKDKLYVSIMVFESCNVLSNSPEDLKIMGDVAKQEYYCFAEYVKIFKKMPRFNDKKNTRKKDKKK